MASDAPKALNGLGQSLWLDNITRDLLDSGTLKRYIDELSVTGLTSNPTIFDRAISRSTSYDAEIRRDDDEVWATNCQFYQPQAAASAKDGIVTDYAYRVMTPFATVLYKTCPNAADRQDVICLFVQPMDADRCRAYPIMFIIDDESSDAELVQFQQMIFLQDRIILENQRPILLPLGPRAEMPTRADACSSAYRRWLKEKGITFGALVGVE